MIKHFGNYSLSDGKIRITLEETRAKHGSVESVLFEDVSSLSWSSCSSPNYKGFLLMLFPIFGAPVIEELGASIFLGLGCAAIAGGLWYAYGNPIKWDNVILETRGGKIITWSVAEGDGMNVMEKIEEDRRNHVGQ